MDFYNDMETLQDTFVDFINKVPFYGAAIVYIDDVHISQIMGRIIRRCLTYGTQESATYYWRNAVFDGNISQYDLYHGGNLMGRFTLNVPGAHNINNSIAAIAVGLELGIDLEKISEGLEHYAPVSRRFQIKGEIHDILIVDDYGHHPAEIAAVIKAARSGWSRRIIAIFQPHRYTRTRDLADSFGESFSGADVVITTEVYSAGESPIEGVNGFMLNKKIRNTSSAEVAFFNDFAGIIDYVLKIAKPGDMVITLGAGNVHSIGDTLMQALARSNGSQEQS
jgi:UDP-N-acetylmuramate--alanine ligase